MSSLKELKERVFEANMELVRKDLVIYTFGNVSGIDRSRGIVAIKPSGVPYDELSPDSIVLVDLDNTVVEGTLSPSSDTKTHLVLYRSFPTVGGIAHTHSTFATAWAQAKRDIPCFGTTHADCAPGCIPCTRILTDDEIRGDYETETGNVIVERFDGLSYEETQMALVASHGPFSWGETPEKAVCNSVILEELAKTALYTELLNSSTGEIQQTLLDRHFRRKHGDNAYYGQSRDDT